MQIDSENLDYGIIKVNLSGRMDVQGVQAIEANFAELTAGRKTPVLVDMSEVDFLVSLGLRILLASAKTLSNRGGYMVLYKPQPNVLDVLDISGVSDLIPIYDNLEETVEALARHQGLR